MGVGGSRFPPLRGWRLVKEGNTACDGSRVRNGAKDVAAVQSPEKTSADVGLLLTDDQEVITCHGIHPCEDDRQQRI